MTVCRFFCLSLGLLGGEAGGRDSLGPEDFRDFMESLRAVRASLSVTLGPVSKGVISLAENQDNNVWSVIISEQFQKLNANHQ